MKPILPYEYERVYADTAMLNQSMQDTHEPVPANAKEQIEELSRENAILRQELKSKSTKGFAPAFLCAFVSMYMFGMPSGKMPVIAQALHYVTLGLLYAFDQTVGMRTAITVSIGIQFLIDVLTAVAYVAYVSNTVDTSIAYYWDLTRTLSIVLICIGDVLVYPSVISHMYDLNVKQRPLRLATWTTVCIWIFQTMSLLLSILARTDTWTDASSLVFLGVTHAGMYACIIGATVPTYAPEAKTATGHIE